MTFKVDFIGIGSGKCGSTWLHDNIALHPEICDKNLKELNYFSDLYSGQPISWYEQQFSACNNSIKGEFSVTYITHPKAAERIYQHFPDVKLLAIVRSPVKRAFSNYLHSIRKGDIPAKLAFSEYIKDEKRLLPGRYAEYLEPYLRYFAPEQLMVIITEEFVRNPAVGYRKVFEHIGVRDTAFLPPAHSSRSNVARSYRFLWLENILVRSYRTLSKKGYTRLVKKITDSGVADVLRKLNQGNKALPKIDEESRDILLDYYQPYNRKLEDLLNVKLDFWDAPGERR